jgi:hypothetical protein
MALFFDQAVPGQRQARPALAARPGQIMPPVTGLIVSMSDEDL